MLKILQARLQQYVNHEFPDVQARFRKGRGASRRESQRGHPRRGRGETSRNSNRHRRRRASRRRHTRLTTVTGVQTCALPILMLKILQARLQQYLNCELPDVQACFRKDRGTRDQIANIRWIMENAREFQKKTSISALLTVPKPLTV